MAFSQEVIFRHGHLEQVSCDLCVFSSIVRFKIDGEFFFTDLRAFDSREKLTIQLNDLEVGQEVFLGAHLLADGSFWLHWLKAPGRIELIPPPPEKNIETAWKKLTIWGTVALLGLIFSGILFFSNDMDKMGWGVLLFICSVTCLTYVCGYIGALVNNAGTTARRLRQGLERLNAAQAEGRPWNMPELGASTAISPPEIPDELPRELRLCRVDHAQVLRKSATHKIFLVLMYMVRMKKITIDYLIYTFDCEGVSVSWSVQDIVSVRNNGPRDKPVSRIIHPPFLASGDQVIVFCADSPSDLTGPFGNAGLPNLASPPVLELFNLTDQTAYLSEHDLHGSVPFAYFLMGLILIVCLPVIGLMGVFSSSEPWFFPVILDALKILAFATSAGVLGFGGILLIVECASAMSRRDPKFSSGRKRWREIVKVLKRPSDSSILGSSLWERRIWIVLALMSLAALCLSFFVLIDS